MEFVPTLAALALVVKIVGLLKYLRSGDMNAVLTQLVTWAAGVGVIFLLARTDYASGINVGDLNLAVADGYSLLLIGLSVSSTGSLIYDFKKARDNTDSASEPPLLPSGTSTPPQYGD